MAELVIRKLEDEEKIGIFSDVILVKKEHETIAYDVTELDNVSICDVLSRVFEDNSIETFEVACSEEQNFLAGLTSIRGFKISGMLSDGGNFEVIFNHFSLNADELLEVENNSNYIGIAEYDERTTEWITESTLNKDSELYLFFREQAEKRGMEISELDCMLDEIADHCSGSDVEY